MKIYKFVIIVLLVCTLLLSSCSSDDRGDYTVTNPPTNPNLTNSLTPSVTVSDTPTSSTPAPTNTTLKLKPFTPVHPNPITDIKLRSTPEIVKEMTGYYSPYTVIAPNLAVDENQKVYNASTNVDFIGGFKGNKWYNEFDFYYNGKDYSKIFADLELAGKYDEIDKLNNQLTATGVTSALINDNSVLKLYSKSGYAGEFKLPSIRMGYSESEFLHFRFSNHDIEIELPPEIVIGISAGEPFPRKPVFQNDGRNFEIDLNNDGNTQKVMFHEVIRESIDEYSGESILWFEIVCELVAYDKSYVLTYSYKRVNKNSYIGNHEEIFKELYGETSLDYPQITLDIIPIDLNNDGKMELVCYGDSHDHEFKDCIVYAFENNELIQVNSYMYGH